MTGKTITEYEITHRELGLSDEQAVDMYRYDADGAQI